MSPKPRLPITREADGDGFVYRLAGRRVTSRAELERIASLAVPSAWTDVRIARSRSAKVLARGLDEAGRVQAIYHPRYRRRRDRLKYDRMMRFGEALPRLRSRVDRDLAKRRLTRDRVAACVVRLIDEQLFRVGNSEYAERYRSYGITTLRAEHVDLTSNVIDFNFVGKSGKPQQRHLRDPRAARVIARLLELPGPEVFAFLDENDAVRSLRSRHVNAYVKRHMGEEFSAKDFRTWGATVTVATELFEAHRAGELEEAEQCAAVVRDAVRTAAERLGNTAAVTRSSYVDPRIVEAADRPELLGAVLELRLRSRKYLDRDERRTLALLSLAAHGEPAPTGTASSRRRRGES